MNRIIPVPTKNCMAELRAQLQESATLEKLIETNLGGLGYGG